MRELDLFRQFDAIAAADSEGGGAPLAHAVERENRRLVERTRKERAGRVALMMIRERERRLQAGTKLLLDDFGKVDLFLQPYRQCRAEALVSARRKRQVGFDEPLELAERPFIEHNVVDVRGRLARVAQAVLDSPSRKARIV